MSTTQESDHVEVIYAILCCILSGEILEVTGDLIIVINFEKLQVGARLEKVGDTLRLLDTGEFQQDLTLLVLELLDVGSHNAKLVDTSAEDVEGSIDLAVDLLIEGSDYLIVGGVALELTHELAFTHEET